MIRERVFHFSNLLDIHDSSDVGRRRQPYEERVVRMFSFNTFQRQERDERKLYSLLDVLNMKSRHGTDEPDDGDGNESHCLIHRHFKRHDNQCIDLTDSYLFLSKKFYWKDDQPIFPWKKWDVRGLS